MSCSWRMLSSFSIPIAIFVLGTSPALSQDANLESRLDSAIIQTPPQVLRPRIEEEIFVTSKPTTRVKTEDKKKSIYTLNAILNKDRGGGQRFSALPVSKRNYDVLCADIKKANQRNKTSDSCTYRVKRLVPGYKQVVIKKPVEKAATTQLVLTAPLSESFQTNALTQPDARADRLFTSGVDATLSVPLNADYTLALNANYTGLRYDRFETRDQDTLTGFVTLSRFIKPNQAVTAKFQSRSSWKPGFEGDPTVFHQPSLQWSIKDLDLGGPQCGAGATAKSCIGWTVILGGGHTFVESLDTAENTFANLQFNAAWPLLPGKLSWQSSGKATGRNYEHTRANREDIQFDAATGLEWTPSPNFIFSAGGAYTRNDSTFDPVEYTNYQFQPQVKVKWVFE